MLNQIERRREQNASDKISVSTLAERAKDIQDRLQADDPVALKNAYRELFEAIYAAPVASDGTIQLRFVLNGRHPAITEEEQGSVGERMVGAEGLEPPIRRL